WGVSTRLLGAIIMTHGDNRGVIIPPRVAPYQIDLIELFAEKNPKVKKVSQFLNTVLSRKWRVRIDATDKAPGYKAANSEIQGVPLRIEIGPRDLENDNVTIVRRDTLEKITVNYKEVKNHIKNILEHIHNNLYDSALARLEQNTVWAYDYDEFKKLVSQNKFVIIPFCCLDEAEMQIKAETGA
ncbi:proline--tRNA ligase, partial [Mycoplasmopsis pullorum]